MSKKSALISTDAGVGELLKTDQLPAESGKKLVSEPSLQVQMPARLIKQLKMAAVERETSVRVIVLEALRAHGFDVGEITDRRRKL